MITMMPKTEHGVLPPAGIAEPLLVSAQRDATVPIAHPLSEPAAIGVPPCTLPVEAIFREHAPRVYGLARRLLGNAADAEDVTQDVFVQVIRKLPTFRGEAALATWLYRITVNAALAYRRKRAIQDKGRMADPLEEFHEDGTHLVAVQSWAKEPEQLLGNQETHQLIEGAIARLPVIYRDVFVLADVEELPNPEIAALLGLSVTAVKSRLHRARLLMRKALAPHFEEMAA